MCFRSAKKNYDSINFFGAGGGGRTLFATRLHLDWKTIDLIQFEHEGFPTCARAHVYMTATQGLPELDLMAAGANGKPV